MLGHKRIPSREGGIEIVVEELATRMVTLGHKVTCYNRSGHHVSGKDFDGGKRKAYKGVRLKSVLTLDRFSNLFYNYWASYLIRSSSGCSRGIPGNSLIVMLEFPSSIALDTSP